jgi:hypothetical protein
MPPVPTAWASANQRSVSKPAAITRQWGWAKASALALAAVGMAWRGVVW